jgi:RluA family pseudouridine synthase
MYLRDFPGIQLNEDQLESLRRHLILPIGGSLIGDVVSESRVKINDRYSFTHTFSVKKDGEGKPLIDYLSSKFPYRLRLDWEAKIIAGEIKCNGNMVSPTALLSINQTITHRNIGVVEPSVPDDIRVLTDLDDYIVIDKPAPIPMHPGGRYNRNTVVNMLEDAGYGKLFLVHRLDAVTSGVVVLAKNKKVANMISELIKSGMGKKYEAIVSGVPEQDTIRIKKGIRRHGGYVFECSDERDAKTAETAFEVIHRGDGWAHIKCTPITGRTHQIRLHLREWGFPVWNDPLYGPGVQLSNFHSTLQRRAISLVSMGFFELD